MAEADVEKKMEIEPNPDGSIDAVDKNGDETEIKVGSLSNIKQSEMGKISKDFIKVKNSSVNSNFLFLRAGANALLPKNTPKSTKQKVVQKSNQKPADTKDTKDPIETEPTDKDENSSAGKDSKQQDESSRPQSSKYKWRDDNYDPYYCKVCDLQLNSEQTYVTHVEGKKHQKKLAAYKARPPPRNRVTENLQYAKVKEGCKVPKIPKPNALPHLKHCEFEKQGEPIVGLSYVSEIWPIDRDQEDIYYCDLCDVTCGPNAIINHVVGFKHRLAYLKYHDPENYEDVKNMTSKKSELTSVLHTHALVLEKRDGPGKMIVEMEVDDYDYDYVAEDARNFRQYSRPEPYFDLRPGNLVYLLPNIKMKIMEETEATIKFPNLITQTMIDSIEFSLNNMRNTLSNYMPLDNSLRRRIIRFLEDAELDCMQHEQALAAQFSTYQNIPFPHQESVEMAQASHYRQNQDTAMRQPAQMTTITQRMRSMPTEFGQPRQPRMPTATSPQGPHNVKNQIRQQRPSMDDNYIPPFPYEKNAQQQIPPANAETWGPMTPSNQTQHGGMPGFRRTGPNW